MGDEQENMSEQAMKGNNYFNDYNVVKGLSGIALAALIGLGTVVLIIYSEMHILTSKIDVVSNRQESTEKTLDRLVESFDEFRYRIQTHGANNHS